MIKNETAKNAGGEDIVNLKWVIIGNGMPDNYDSWIGKVNDYIGEKNRCQPGNGSYSMGRLG